MKRVLMIAYPFPPLASSGVHRTVRFCRYLREFGWQPIVLTVEESDAESYVPRDHSLLSKLPADSEIYRTKVLKPLDPIWKLKRMLRGSRSSASRPASNGQSNGHLPSPPATRGKLSRFLSRLITNLSIPDDQIVWLPPCYFAAKQLVESENIDLIYTTGFPWSTHLTGILLRRQLDKPWIADFRDPWINNPWRKPFPAFRNSIDGRLERMVMKNADTVIANTAFLLRDFRERYPDVADKFVSLTNGFDPADFSEFAGKAGKNPNDSSRPLCITHAGRFYNRRNPSDFLQAVADLISEGYIPASDISIKFMGDSAPHVKAFIDRLGLQNVVELQGDLPHKECLARLYDADVLLLIEPDRTLQVPFKMYEYIKVGRPVFGVVEKNSIVTEMIGENDIGFAAEPGNIADIKKKLRALYLSFKKNELKSSLPQSLVDRFDGRLLTRDLTVIMEKLVPEEYHGIPGSHQGSANISQEIKSKGDYK